MLSLTRDLFVSGYSTATIISFLTLSKHLLHSIPGITMPAMDEEQSIKAELDENTKGGTTEEFGEREASDNGECESMNIDQQNVVISALSKNARVCMVGIVHK